jgi:uncharacterized protein YybS (DUF2232 family)
LQAFAAWLVARPQNALIGLVATLLLPLPGLMGVASSMIVVLLIMTHGWRRAALQVGVAGAVLVAMALVVGFAVPVLTELMALFWLPALLLGALLQKSRSLTLTMQVSVIIAIVALTAFYVVVPDPVAFWEPRVAEAAEAMIASGFELRTELLQLEYLTVSAVFMGWTIGTTGFLLGYGVYRKLPTETAEFGRFRDLNFGRVIAFAVALVSLLAIVVDAAWLKNVAPVLFVIFWLQGLAIVHYMHAQQLIPIHALVAVYVLVPLLQVLIVTVLAIIGYMDAWFDFRRRMIKA